MIQGMITPMVTPFCRDNNQKINYEATDQLIDRLIDKGIDGLFLLGSNGEFQVLTENEKLQFVEHVTKKVDKRIPVYVGTGSCSLRESIRLSKKMELLGVDALSVLAPYFFEPTEEELYYYFSSIANSVEIPIILYNIPKTVGYKLSPELVEKLSSIKNVKGIKDSSGDLELFESYINATKNTDTVVLIGSDSKIAQAYALGAKGAVAGTSNLLTDQLVGFNHALKYHEVDKISGYQQAIEELRKILKLGTVPSALKRSIELAGIAEVGPARYPTLELSEEADKEIQEMLKKIGINKER